MAIHKNLDYAKSYVVLNLNKSLKNYKNFVLKMRNLKRASPNDGELTSDDLSNIILKYQKKKLTLKMTTSDYYVYGYKDNNGKLWELRISKNKVKRLKNSKPAGIGLTYPKLTGLKINRQTVIKAFNQLNEMGGNNNEISKDAAILCLILAEASRFYPIGNEVGDALCKESELIIDEWIEKLIKNWADLSAIAALCKEKHVALTEKEKGLLNSRNFDIFDTKDGKYTDTQCRMAKAIIAVLHIPRAGGLC